MYVVYVYVVLVNSYLIFVCIVLTMHATYFSGKGSIT